MKKQQKRRCSTSDMRQLLVKNDKPRAMPATLLPVRPRLGRAVTPRKGATAPAQVNVCQARIAKANKTVSEVCGMSGVTLPGCMYSCRDQQRTAERCICCWPGLQLLNNSCTACPVGTTAKVSGTNTCQACGVGYSTNKEASIACNVCAAGYGVPRRDFGQPVWTCAKCPLGTYSAGSTTQACTKCQDGFTTAAVGATGPTDCIPAVCSSPPPPLPGIPSWPASCAGQSSCTAACSGDYTGSVTVLCGPNDRWLQPTQPCQQETTGALLGELSISSRIIMLSSDDLVDFTAVITAPLSAAAEDVKLFTCDAAGTPLKYIADMQPTSNATPPGSSSIYLVSLSLHGPQLGSLSTSPGVRLFTVVLGADNNGTGAVAQLELIAGCASAPTAGPPAAAWPWNATVCAAAAVGQQCLTNCEWPSYDDQGFWVTCLPDGTWSGPGGYCFPRSCNGFPGPEWAISSCPYTPVGLQCNAPCSDGLVGSGYSAVCSITGWQVLSKNCSNHSVEDTSCKDLPTQQRPAGSKGWDPGCAGRNSGSMCKAACDVNFFGRGYTATCDQSEWTVLTGDNCQGCTSGTIFGYTTESTVPDRILAMRSGKVFISDGLRVAYTFYIWNATSLTKMGAVTSDVVSAFAELPNGDILIAMSPGSNGNPYVVVLDDSLSLSGTLTETPGLVITGLAVANNNDVLGAVLDKVSNKRTLRRWANGDFNQPSTTLDPPYVDWDPEYVAVDKRSASGNIVAIDSTNQYIVVYSSSGKSVLRVVKVSYVPKSVAVGPDGKIFVTGDDVSAVVTGYLFVYDNIVNYLGRYGGYIAPRGVSVDADGVVWVAQSTIGSNNQFSSGLRISCFKTA